MRGVVVKNSKPLGRSGVGKSDAFLPRGMPSPDTGQELILRIGTVVDQQVRILRELQDIGVELLGPVLGVGHVGDRASPVFEPISRGAARMIQRRCESRCPNSVSTYPRPVVKLEHARKRIKNVVREDRLAKIRQTPV